MANAETFPSAAAYAAEVKPKLTVLHQIVMENARDNATKHWEVYDRTSSEPSFDVGSKVLLFDPTTKKGKSAKLTVKWRGPYLIVVTKAGYNYKLKELKSGKEMKRFVHTNRLHPLRR